MLLDNHLQALSPLPVRAGDKFRGDRACGWVNNNDIVTQVAPAWIEKVKKPLNRAVRECAEAL